MKYATQFHAAVKAALKTSFWSAVGLLGVTACGVGAANAQNANLEHMAFAAGTDQSDRQTISIRAGETLEQALLRAGGLRDDVTAALRSLARTLDPRDIRRDDKVTIFMQAGAGGNRLAGFNLASGAERSVTVTRGFDNVFRSREMTTNMQRKTLRVAGVVTEAGLVNAIREQGAPDRAADSIAQAFAYDVDFEREVVPGTEFELMYDRVSDLRGQVVREGTSLCPHDDGRRSHNPIVSLSGSWCSAI